MRIAVLFALPDPQSLRFFEGTIAALRGRGHRVIVAFERNAEEWQPAEGVQVVPAIPHAENDWTFLLHHLGLSLDYLRYAEPAFRRTPYLRQRMEKYVPDGWEWIRRVRRVPRWAGRLLHRAARVCDTVAVVPEPNCDFIRELAPDLVVVSPLILRGRGSTRQGDVVRAARAVGVPVTLAVGSWDHLSSKGVIRSSLDAVQVWNDVQRGEAIDLHDVPAERVLTTGALPFDEWFDRQPRLSRDAFLRRVGIEPCDRLIVYVGSSPNITHHEREIAFVRRWLTALRAHPGPIATAGVLVRPHPGNVAGWEPVDLQEFGNVSIWPRVRPPIPMPPEAADDFFHSLFFSAAVVGVNTSAMIEAAVVGRPVCTIRDGAFESTQDGTVHFHYLLPEGGGCVLDASSLDEHLRQLDDLVTGRLSTGEATKAFVERFVRPHGLSRPASDVLADQLETLAARGPVVRPPAAAGFWRRVTGWLAAQEVRRIRRRRAERQAAGRVPYTPPAGDSDEPAGASDGV